MLKDSLKTIILSAIVLFLMGVAYAWTEPSQSPPLGNVSAPITTSGTGQTKTGSLEVNGLWNRGTTILDGNVGIGTASPGQKLTVAGTIESISGGIKFPDGTTQTSAGIQGGGATNYLPKFTGSGTIGNSTIYDDGTTVTINSYNVRGATYSFGGMFTTYNFGANCQRANPFTGACNCPTDFGTYQIYDPGGGTMVHVCAK